ncbi:MAG TPA: hypothetical protein VGH56_04845 [Solirubrobacteraceae bacterium]
MGWVRLAGAIYADYVAARHRDGEFAPPRIGGADDRGLRIARQSPAAVGRV